MSSITKTQKRSKKTTRLGPVQVLRPDQYETFDKEKLPGTFLVIFSGGLADCFRMG